MAADPNPPDRWRIPSDPLQNPLVSKRSQRRMRQLLSRSPEERKILGPGLGHIATGLKKFGFPGLPTQEQVVSGYTPFASPIQILQEQLSPKSERRRFVKNALRSTQWPEFAINTSALPIGTGAFRLTQAHETRQNWLGGVGNKEGSEKIFTGWRLAPSLRPPSLKNPAAAFPTYGPTNIQTRILPRRRGGAYAAPSVDLEQSTWMDRFVSGIAGPQTADDALLGTFWSPVDERDAVRRLKRRLGSDIRREKVKLQEIASEIEQRFPDAIRYSPTGYSNDIPTRLATRFKRGRIRDPLLLQRLDLAMSSYRPLIELYRNPRGHSRWVDVLRASGRFEERKLADSISKGRQPLIDLKKTWLALPTGPVKDAALVRLQSALAAYKGQELKPDQIIHQQIIQNVHFAPGPGGELRRKTLVEIVRSSLSNIDPELAKQKRWRDLHEKTIDFAVTKNLAIDPRYRAHLINEVFGGQDPTQSTLREVWRRMDLMERGDRFISRGARTRPLPGSIPDDLTLPQVFDRVVQYGYRAGFLKTKAPGFKITGSSPVPAAAVASYLREHGLPAVAGTGLYQTMNFYKLLVSKGHLPGGFDPHWNPIEQGLRTRVERGHLKSLGLHFPEVQSPNQLPEPFRSLVIGGGWEAEEHVWNKLTFGDISGEKVRALASRLNPMSGTFDKQNFWSPSSLTNLIRGSAFSDLDLPGSYGFSKKLTAAVEQGGDFGIQFGLRDITANQKLMDVEAKPFYTDAGSVNRAASRTLGHLNKAFGTLYAIGPEAKDKGIDTRLLAEGAQELMQELKGLGRASQTERDLLRGHMKDIGDISKLVPGEAVTRIQGNFQSQVRILEKLYGGFSTGEQKKLMGAWGRLAEGLYGFQRTSDVENWSLSEQGFEALMNRLKGARNLASWRQSAEGGGEHVSSADLLTSDMSVADQEVFSDPVAGRKALAQISQGGPTPIYRSAAATSFKEGGRYYTGAIRDPADVIMGVVHGGQVTFSAKGVGAKAIYRLQDAGIGLKTIFGGEQHVMVRAPILSSALQKQDPKFTFREETTGFGPARTQQVRELLEKGARPDVQVLPRRAWVGNAGSLDWHLAEAAQRLRDLRRDPSGVIDYMSRPTKPRQLEYHEEYGPPRPGELVAPEPVPAPSAPTTPTRARRRVGKKSGQAGVAQVNASVQQAAVQKMAGTAQTQGYSYEQSIAKIKKGAAQQQAADQIQVSVRRQAPLPMSAARRMSIVTPPPEPPPAILSAPSSAADALSESAAYFMKKVSGRKLAIGAGVVGAAAVGAYALSRAVPPALPMESGVRQPPPPRIAASPVRIPSPSYKRANDRLVVRDPYDRVSPGLFSSMSGDMGGGNMRVSITDDRIGRGRIADTYSRPDMFGVYE